MQYKICKIYNILQYAIFSKNQSLSPMGILQTNSYVKCSKPSSYLLGTIYHTINAHKRSNNICESFVSQYTIPHLLSNATLVLISMIGNSAVSTVERIPIVLRFLSFVDTGTSTQQRNNNFISMTKTSSSQITFPCSRPAFAKL